MANRFYNVPGNVKIKIDYPNITLGFDRVAAELDSHQSQITAEQQARITQVQNHIQQIAAHTAAAITLSPVAGMTAQTVQVAVEQLRNLLTTIIAGAAPSAAEIKTARMGADGIVRDELGILIQEIHAKLIANNKATSTLGMGPTLINAAEAGPLSVTLQGRSLFNLLDPKTGNCEVASSWTPNLSTITVDNSNYVYGSGSLKVTSSDVSGTAYKNIKGLLSTDKYYLILGDVKNGNAISGNVHVQLQGGSSTSKNGNLITDASKFATSYVKLRPSDIADATSILLHLYARGTAAGQYVYHDGVRVYEIGGDTYNKIDVDPEYTGEKLAAKFPYVDGLKHLTNPIITKTGKNNFDMNYPFSGVGADAFIATPTSVLVTSTASVYRYVNQKSYPVVPNTTYTLSYKASSESGPDLPAIGVRKGSDINATIAVKEAAGDVVLTFNTEAETSIYLCFFGSRATASAQQKRYENIQLEIGSTATSYELRNDDYLIIQDTLIGFWGIIEELTVKGTEASKLKKWGSFTLDGTKNYTLNNDYVGYKTFAITNFDSDAQSAGACIGTDHLGNPIGTMFPSGSLGRAVVTTYGSVATFFINIPDSITGFGETYSPSLAEMQAFFRGWKMNNGAFGTPYNGVGVKVWTKWDATSNDGSVLTLPTGTAAGYTPYKFNYQLSPSKYHAVPISVEGSLSNHQGYNTYTLEEGVIIREKVYPKLDAGTYYIISSVDTFWGGARTANLMKTPLKVYRDGQYDPGWVQGTYSMTISPADYVNTSLYYISYVIKDKHRFTAPLLSATVEYDTSSKMVQDMLVQRSSDIETRLTTHDYILAYLASRVLLLG